MLNVLKCHRTWVCFIMFFIEPNIQTYMYEIFSDNVLYYDLILEKFNENVKD